MIYFILWVVFLVIVLAAIPLALLWEKRQRGASAPTAAEPAAADAVDDDPLAEAASDEDPVAFETAPEAAAVGEPEFAELEGADDFGEFDDLK